MSEDYIGNVLGLLRKLKQTNMPGNAVSDNIRRISGQALDESEVLRFAAYVRDQASAANSLIANSTLPMEAKDGLIETTQAIMSAFSLGGINNSISSYFPKLDSSLSSFAILAGVRGSVPISSDIPEVVELVTEIDELREKLATYDLDPVILETTMRHLSILSVLLRNVDAVGIDSALAAYAELMLRFRRSAAGSSEKSKAGIETVWKQIEQWTGRLTLIDHAINSGSSILSHLPAVSDIVHSLPSITL